MTSEVVQALTPKEQLRLNECENDIETAVDTISKAFQLMAQAVYIDVTQRI